MEIAFDYCWVECFIILANFDGTVIEELSSGSVISLFGKGLLLVVVLLRIILANVRYNLSLGR